MITVAETSEYARRARKLLSENERTKLVNYLATYPEAGDILEGTGGVRKIRWARGDQGRSGGVRVIYYYYNQEIPLYLLTLYGKNEKSNLTGAERKTLTGLVKILLKAAGKE